VNIDADAGDVGRKIVRFGWFFFSIPLLVLIYFGYYLGKANLCLCKFYMDRVLKVGDEG
jgi:K+ transporter